MATTTLLANAGNDRLVVRTICSHLMFFHEAGFEYRTERKQRTPTVWWNPATWRGFRWRPSDDATQPRALRCTFNRDGDPAAFGATPQTSAGFYKLTCEHLSVRRHCVWLIEGDAASSPRIAVADDNARRVRDVVLRFTYDDRACTLRHAGGGSPSTG
jgi:hypothetical protein